MIQSFHDKETERLFAGLYSKRFPVDVVRPARRKMAMMQATLTLEDLKHPPGNRLELLKGNRAGQYSIRVNEQWRICFRWESDGAWDVELVDYH